MKKFLLIFALFIGAGSLYNNTIEAQNINISINIGHQPAWGPVGYDYAGYYYFPDIDVYYNVNRAMFYYPERGRWISVRYLPPRYHNYDLYGLYKVVLNVNDPWRYHQMHYRDYAKYRGYRKQVVIRDTRDVRYRESRNNRVAWYSDNRRFDQRSDSRYENKGRDKNYPDRSRFDNGRERNNYRSEDNRNNDKSYGRSDNRSNDRPDDRTKRNYSNSRDNQSVEKARPRDSREVRSASKRSQGYRLASNVEQNERRSR